jgi:hypothetical protein
MKDYESAELPQFAVEDTSSTHEGTSTSDIDLDGVLAS